MDRRASHVLALPLKVLSNMLDVAKKAGSRSLRQALFTGPGVPMYLLVVLLILIGAILNSASVAAMRLRFAAQSDSDFLRSAQECSPRTVVQIAEGAAAAPREI